MGHTDIQGTSPAEATASNLVAPEVPGKGEKLHHSLFWIDPFGKDDHVSRTILGEGIVFPF